MRIKKLSRLLLAFTLLFLFSHLSYTQSVSRTMGLMQIDQDRVEDGYVLWSPLFANSKYLMDNCGNVVHSWDNGLSLGNSMYLMEDGRMLVTAKNKQTTSVIQIGGSGERVQILDWESNVLWDYSHFGDSFRVHHDVALLPNGNVLILVFEAKGSGECVSAGRDPSKITEGWIASEGIYEIKPKGENDGEIIWEWHLWDHLVQDHDPAKANYGVPSDHPELLNLNYINTKVGNVGEADWIHGNSLEYNAELDQILFNSQRLGEFWILDHNTTSAEAALHSGGAHGKGGDFLYRWGNPEVYGAGDSSNQQLSGFHNPDWVDAGLPNAGKIMAFNNGTYSGTNTSSIVIIDPPVDANGDYDLTTGQAYGPAAPFWEYKAPSPTDFYSWFISGAQQLPNGNVLVCSGANGRLFEVTATKDIVWEYINPEAHIGRMTQGDTIAKNGNFNGNLVFRAQRYPFDYAAFAGRDLSPQEKVELEPLDDACIGNRFFPPTALVYPNPSSSQITVEIDNLYGTFSRLTIFNTMGKRIYDNVNPQPETLIDISNWKPGMYILRLGDQQYTRFVKVR